MEILLRFKSLFDRIDNNETKKRARRFSSLITSSLSFIYGNDSTNFYSISSSSNPIS